MKEKGQTREEVISQLARRIDSFGKYPPGHSAARAALAAQLSSRLGLSKTDAEAIEEAALLHDVGLFTMTPGYHESIDPLTFEERVDLWRHPVIGEQQMAKYEASRHAQLLVRWHHEWWSGTGYPDMLAYEDIPIGARILRAVDLYTSLIADRPYRNRLSEEAARAELKESAGSECDPYIVQALLALLADIAPPAVEPDPVRDTVTPADQAYSSSPVASEAGEPPASQFAESVTPPQDPRPDSAYAAFASPRPEPEPVSSEDSDDALDMLVQARAQERKWIRWRSGRYNKKSLLGFEASVLRQIEFKSIAIPFCGRARLEWYLSAWGKQILSNDSRAWAAALSRAVVGAAEPLSEEVVARALEDAYVPAGRLANPALRRWFGETDSWFMDNLRRNIDALADEEQRAEALAIGLLTGDYALSFDEETVDLKRPLTAVYRALASRSYLMLRSRARGRVNTYNLPAVDFMRRARADLLYLDTPVAHTEVAGSDARSDWRDSWVRQGENKLQQEAPQSKQAYLSGVDQLLRSASHIKTWAIGIQETGLASARDINDLIKEHRQAHTTYSKDLTEVAGGLRNYIVVATVS